MSTTDDDVTTRELTEEEVAKVEAWAQTPGVTLASLPLEYRAAVEAERDRLAADDGEPAGELELEPAPMEERTVEELERIAGEDEPAASLALAELEDRARDKDGVDRGLAIEVLDRYTLARDVDEEGKADSAIDLPGHRPDVAGDEPARRFRAEANARGVELAEVGRIVAAYHNRRRRLAALEVKDTRDARQAKLELELGEAVEALEAIEHVLEVGA